MTDPKIKEQLMTLTQTETKILYFKCQKFKIWKIASNLGYSDQWVSLHMTNVYAKLGFDPREHWTSRIKKLEKDYCPVLCSLINNLEDFDQWPPDSIKPPVLIKEYELAVREDRKREEKKEDEGENIEEGEFQIKKVKELLPPPEEDQGKTPPPPKPRDPWWKKYFGCIIVGCGCSLITILALVILIYMALQNPPFRQMIVNFLQPNLVMATAAPKVMETSAVIPIIQSPTLTFPVQPTVTIPQTFTPFSDLQNPPPETIIPFGEYYSKSGISVSLSDFNYSHKEISFYINIRNDRSENYLFRFRPTVFSATDNLGHQYHVDDGSGRPIDELKTTTIDAQDSGGYNVWSSTWFIYGEIGPEVTQLFIHATDLAGMQDLTWVYDF